MKNIYVFLSQLLKNKRPLVLATILRTRGSAPQIPGASAIFAPKGLLAGTLGGGILEADAQKKASFAIENAVSLLSHFRLNQDLSSTEGAICGGEVQILLDASSIANKEAFEKMALSLEKRKYGLLITYVDKLDGEKVRVKREWLEYKEEFEKDLSKLLQSYRKEIRACFEEGTPRILPSQIDESFLEKNRSFLFLEPQFPLPELVIVGAGHIGRALAHLGSLLDFEITVIDDRPEFANTVNLPDADHIIVEEAGKAILDIRKTPDTYIVIVSRGHRHDAEALRSCITSEPAYIGMIGSRRKIALMRQKFLEEGWANSKQFDRIFAPIGLNIDSKTVEEIAVSIAAELVLVRRQKINKTKRKL